MTCGAAVYIASVTSKLVTGVFLEMTQVPTNDGRCYKLTGSKTRPEKMGNPPDFGRSQHVYMELCNIRTVYSFYRLHLSDNFVRVTHIHKVHVFTSISCSV